MAKKTGKIGLSEQIGADPEHIHAILHANNGHFAAKMSLQLPISPHRQHMMRSGIIIFVEIRGEFCYLTYLIDIYRRCGGPSRPGYEQVPTRLYS
jgi:hypothetical protein